MSVKTFACTFSASATRAFHAASLRLTRPISIAGFFAPESSCAALAMLASSGRTGAADWKRDTSGSVRARIRRFLVQTEQHLRLFVAEVIDDAVVQAAVARARIERQIRNVERTQHGSDRIAAPVFLRLWNRRRNVTKNFTRHGCLPP